MTQREALLAMGYREALPRKWTKQFGFHLLTFSEELGEWTNWFLAGTGETLVWERKKFEAEDYAGDFVRQIKHWEAYTRINIAASEGSHFEKPRPDL